MIGWVKKLPNREPIFEFHRKILQQTDSIYLTSTNYPQKHQKEKKKRRFDYILIWRKTIVGPYKLLRIIIILILMQLKKQQHSIVCEQTFKRFHQHLSIIRKIVETQLWTAAKQFPSAIIYQISTFVFSNPLRLTIIMYSRWPDRMLKINERFLIKNRPLQQKQKAKDSEQSKANNQKSSQHSAFITITKQWKALDTTEYGYAQVIQKGRLFLNFLSNIKIKNKPDEPINYDPLKDFDSFKKQEKERSQRYILISDNLNLIRKQFEEIFEYQKHKKINDIVVRAFISLMNNSMAIVKIEENYNSNTLGCEGRYIYIANRHQLPFINNYQGNLTKQQMKYATIPLPWLQLDHNGDWRLGNQRNHLVSVFKQEGYPLTRGRKWLISRNLQYYLQNDVWVQNT